MSTNHKSTLTSGSISGVLTRLTLPMVFGILSIIAFNLVDAYFVGKLGASELAALGFVFPVVMIMGSLGMGLSVGAAAMISRAIGESDMSKVRRLTTDSMVLAALFAFVFVVVGLATIDPVFRLLGAGDEVMVHIRDYMRIWYTGVAFVMIPMVGNSAIRSNGDTLTPAIIMVSMVVVNVILDPILIFGYFGLPAMGVKGAALATVIARAFTLVLGVAILHFREGFITFKTPNISAVVQSWKQILYIGLPAAATNLVVPFTTAVITKLVAEYGKEAVAALGVVARIDVFVLTIIFALGSVIGPFVGQNLGAGQLDRLKKGVRMSKQFALVWGLGAGLLVFFLKEALAPIFNDDEKVIAAFVTYLSVVPVCYAFRGLYALGNTVLNVLNKPLHASVVTIVSLIVVYLPLAHLGSKLFGLIGIFYAIIVAYLVGGLMAHLLSRNALNKLSSKSTIDESVTSAIEN